jgi:hypothetical protein
MNPKDEQHSHEISPRHAKDPLPSSYLLIGKYNNVHNKSY